MNGFLPPMRALQAFEAFGRLGSVSEAARELGVTPGAISQQIKLLEAHVGITLILRDGRGATLGPEARLYHEIIAQGFDRFRQAQHYLSRLKAETDLAVSGLPTLLLKWLNPVLGGFQSQGRNVSIRLEATHEEPDRQMLDTTFRLTYGGVAQRYFHTRVLFTDTCFPVCSPEFLERHPEAADPARLGELPLIEIDWGPAYASVPHWVDWFEAEGQPAPRRRPVAVFSLSSLALEAAANSQGVTLAQEAFVTVDLRLGRLVRLSPRAMAMPEPYYICWGQRTLEQPVARDFLNWIIAESRGGRPGPAS